MPVQSSRFKSSSGSCHGLIHDHARHWVVGRLGLKDYNVQYVQQKIVSVRELHLSCIVTPPRSV